MARPLRVEYPHALYHVTSRGNGKRRIFLDDTDRIVWLRTLEKAIAAQNLIVHAYCLMDNHFHLLVETPEANLAKGMHYLNAAYTQQFNTRHERVGHLLQGRYKAFLIEKETYFLEVARYIVLNPVRAKLVRSPERWKWSNYKAFIGKAPMPEFISFKETFRYFDKNLSRGKEKYVQFVREGIRGESPFTEVQHKFILGSPQFVSEIWERTSGKESEKEHVRAVRFVGRPSLKDLFKGIRTKKRRDDMIRFARYRCGYALIDIAKHAKMSYSSVGKIAKNTKF